MHRANETVKARADREETERTLRDIYDLRDQMEPSVQQLLCRELTDHFAKPLWFNKNWLAIHGPLVKQSVKRAKKKRYRVYGQYDSTSHHGKQGSH